jgi:hypothetical protein
VDDGNKELLSSSSSFMADAYAWCWMLDASFCVVVQQHLILGNVFRHFSN